MVLLTKPLIRTEDILIVSSILSFWHNCLVWCFQWLLINSLKSQLIHKNKEAYEIFIFNTRYWSSILFLKTVHVSLNHQEHLSTVLCSSLCLRTSRQQPGRHYVSGLSAHQSIRPSRCREYNILVRPSGNSFKFGRNINLDSKTNWLHFGGQRSKVKVTVTSQNMFLSITHKFMQ